MNVPFHLALRQARLKRLCYRVLLPWIAPRQPKSLRTLPLHYLSFSCASDLPEQVASFRSFLASAGLPVQTTIVSDESHTPAQIDLLGRLPGTPKIVPRCKFVRPDLPLKVFRYAESMAMGRKLTVMASIPVSGPTLYADSDILFFPPAREFASSDSEWLASSEPRYLLDCYPSFDDRLLRSVAEKETPVNAGFLLLKQPLNWAEPFGRFERIDGEPLFFSEQTMVHLAIRGAGGLPFPPDRFVMRNEDQWEYRDRFVGPNTVMRHYISSFRHKMWLRVVES